MATRFDLGTLFEHSQPDWRATSPYKTRDAELAAVASRRKAVFFYSATRRFVEEDPEFVELTTGAFERGLACVLDPDPDDSPTLPRHLEHIRIFILHHDQLWRVPAFHALWTDCLTYGGWSDAAENQCSLLFGYTPKQRATWIAHQRGRQAAWGCSTLYTLLDVHQKARVNALGRRSLGSPTEIEGMILFKHGHRHEVRRRAAALVPKGLTLARVGLDHDFARLLFGFPWKRGRRVPPVIRGTVNRSQAAKLSPALRSNVQLLTLQGRS